MDKGTRNSVPELDRKQFPVSSKRATNILVLCGENKQIGKVLSDEWCGKYPSYKPLKLPGQDVQSLVELNRQELECVKDNSPFISIGGLDFLLGSQVDAVSHMTKKCISMYQKSLIIVLIESAMPLGEAIFTYLHEHRLPFICITNRDSICLVQTVEEALEGQLPNNTQLNQHVALSLKYFVQDNYKTDCTRLRRLVVTESHITETFTSLPKGKTNRMVTRYGADSFLLVDFNFKMQPADIIAILLKGIHLDGETFEFIGCSSSGLKKRSCYLMRGAARDIKRVRDVECANFPSDMPIPKKLKGIGLLFSNVISTGVVVKSEFVEIAEDIMSRDHCYNFTDGCGAIGSNLHSQIIEGAGLKDQLPEGYEPSVLQIRLEGYKGVVALDPNLNKDSMLIRKSMIKFKSGTKPFSEVCLCNYSKPYSIGFLNKQYIMLLSGLGVPDEILEEKQRKYYVQMQKLKEDSFQQLCNSGQYQLATQVATGNLHEKQVQEELSTIQRKFIEKITKLKIQVSDSRNVFGICDTSQVLEYGECFFRPTIKGQPYTIRGKVVVAKNPCYFLGDVRVLTAIDGKRVEGLQHLIDCIVFPTKGKRPHPDEITGSDLDGDEYFVCWDKELSIEQMRNPTDFLALANASKSKNRHEWKSCIEYVANQVSMMGLLNSHYLYWAETKGVQSIECQELGQLFSRSVDASKTGDKFTIPKHLLPPKGKSAILSSSTVWTRMEQLAEESKHQFFADFTSKPAADAHFSESFIRTILQDQFRKIPEFELLNMLKKWCYSQCYSDSECTEKLISFSKYINFGKFSLQQKLSAMELGIPVKLVTNALNSSQFLTMEMMQKFSLHDPHNRWCFYFHATSADFRWSDLINAVTTYPESLLIYRLPGDITFALHFLSKLKIGEDKILAGSIISYFLSSSFKLLHRHVLDSSFSIDLNREFLQLYRGNKTKSFLWIANTVLESTALAQSKFDRMSIDLTTFQKDIFRKYNHPKVNKLQFDALEVYVKGGTEEPTYYDSLLSDVTCEDTILEEDEESVEEILRDEEAEQGTLVPVRGASLVECLHFYADHGRIGNFSTTLQSMLALDKKEEFRDEISQSICSLLTAVTNKNVHLRKPAKDLDELLPIIISARFALSSPLSSLLVLSKVSMLCSVEYTNQVKDALLSCIKVSTISEYIEVLLHWEWWYFLPQPLANSLAEALYTLSRSLLSEVICPSGSLSDFIAGNMPQETPTGVLEQYVHYYSHLLHHSFLNEINSLRSRPAGSTTASTSVIATLKVCDPQQQIGATEELDNDGNPKSGSKLKRKIEFHRIKGVAFNLEGYVIVSFMTSGVETGFVPVIYGIITDNMSRQPVNVAIEVPTPVPLCLERSIKSGVGHWQLNAVGNVTTYLRGMKALHALLEKGQTTTSLASILTHPQASLYSGATLNSLTTTTETSEPMLSEKILSPSPPVGDESPWVKHIFQNPLASFREAVILNEKQKEALASSLKQNLTLIHGPPGTGKTKVACEIVYQYCSQGKLNDNEQSKILIAAETNMAVDNLARQLMLQGVNVVRIGSREQISSDIYSQISLEKLASSKSQHKGNHIDQKLAKEILKGAKVIATTCAGAGDNILKSLKFPFIIVDEATQVMEPISLIAITKNCQKLTLIGDPEQLAPFHHTQSHDPHAGGASPRLQDLEVTMFHRLHRVMPSLSVFLEEQYRMSSELVKFPSQKFYKGKLRCSSSVKDRVPNFVLRSATPIDFIDVTESRERRDGTSFWNDIEAEIVKNVVDYLISCNVSPNEITVLTPYKKQVQCLLEKLSQRVSRVEVSTIDNFQGKENDVIVFNTVRSNLHGDLNFIAKRNRVNVLLTRARHCVIGVGSEVVLRTLDLWKDWLQQANVIPSDCLERLSVQNPNSNKQSGSKWTRPHAQGSDGKSHGASYSGSADRGRSQSSGSRHLQGQKSNAYSQQPGSSHCNLPSSGHPHYHHRSDYNPQPHHRGSNRSLHHRESDGYPEHHHRRSNHPQHRHEDDDHPQHHHGSGNYPQHHYRNDRPRSSNRSQ